jgi:hypothetical protein
MNGQDIESVGLSETIEEDKDKVSNAESIGNGTLESKRTCLEQKRLLKNAKRFESAFF